MTRSVVLLSGGIDSAVALAQECADHPGQVAALWMDYGANHRAQEKIASRALARFYNVPWHECPCLFIGRTGTSSLTGSHRELHGKATVVPFRNGILLAIALGFAENLGASRVVLGSHAGDAKIYPDCRAEFVAAMNAAAFCGTDTQPQVIAPWLGLTKAQVVERGRALGVPLQLTYSCYAGADEQCGTCGACVEREKAMSIVAPKGSAENPLSLTPCELA